MPAGPARRLLGLPGVRRSVLCSVVLAAAATGLVVVQWSLVAGIVVPVATGTATPVDLAASLLSVLAVWLLRAGLLALRDLLAGRASSAARAEVRRRLVRTWLRSGPEVMSDGRSGELVTTATEGVSRLDGYLARFLPGAAAAAVVPVLVAGTVLVLDAPSGVLLLVTGPLVVVFLWLVGTRAAASTRSQWATLGQLGALLVDTVRVLPTLVAYGRARSAQRWLGEVSEGYRAVTMRVLRTAFLSGFVLEFGATLCTALVAVTVGVRLFQGDLDFERALLVLLLTPEFFAPLRALGADHHAALEGRPAAERVFALLDRPPPPAGTRAVTSRVPGLRLAGVTVRHAGGAVFTDVDLDLPPGSRTALVGPSGAGKSTLAHLLLGFRQPDEGVVLVDGVPLAELDPDSWRARVAYVPERPWLLPGSVADNVRLGRPGADDAEVREALARAHALPFVDRLPLGLHTRLGEDAARLSGGERLRLAIARAFLKDAGVVLLDEPTGHLDPDGEAEVLAALDGLAVGRTLLTITHRPAPVLLHGRVIGLVGGRLQDAGRQC